MAEKQMKLMVELEMERDKTKKMLEKIQEIEVVN
jgi:hypothetical protein